MANSVEELELYAWVGPDQHGSGVVGLKQAIVPAGMIPIVATSVDKAGQSYIVEQMQALADAYGQPIYLARFKCVQIIEHIEPRDRD